MKDTQGSEYTDRLVRLGSKSWKRMFDVQAPYRWNLKRLELGKTLDVGCGLGRNLQNLPNGIGVDHNSDSIKFAKDLGLNAFTTEEWGSSSEAQFGSFDTILLAHVLEHLNDSDGDEVIQAYLPYLKKDGKLVMICPQEKGFPTDPTHIRWVDSKTLNQTGSRHGFIEVKNFSFPFPRPIGRIFKYNEFVYVGVRLSK
jgi:SAM-dependent methyltransferase